MKEVGEYWERGPCPQCGAHTLEEAETLCQPSQTQDGEYVCAQPEEQEDEEGFLLQETAAAIAARDAWVDAEVAKMLAEDDSETEVI